MKTPTPSQVFGKSENPKYYVGSDHSASVQELLSPEQVARLYDLYQSLRAKSLI